jgi:hypothetical protein
MMSDTMIAIEFHAWVKNGTIEVPEPYRQHLDGEVRVIILRTEQSKKSKIIEHLLDHPIQDVGFRPFRRDEVYTRDL